MFSIQPNKAWKAKAFGFISPFVIGVLLAKKLLCPTTLIWRTFLHERSAMVTTYESTTLVVAGLQLFISALGFVVVAWTLRVLVRSIDAQSSAGVAARQLEFDKVILANPCLYKYFYQGQDIAPDDPAYARVMAATQLLAKYFDGYFRQQGMYRQMWPDRM
jgi:hypothetical protein